MACKCCINPETHLKKHAPRLFEGLNILYTNAKHEIKKMESEKRKIKKTGRK